MKYLMTILNTFIFAVILVSLISCANQTRAETGPDSSGSTSVQADAQANPAGSSELLRTVKLSSDDLTHIEKNLNVEITDGANEFYKLGKSDIQVNYLIPTNQDDLKALFDALFKVSGSANAVLLGTDRVFEVISKDPWAAEMIKGDLALAPLQQTKLTPFTVYGEAKIVGDEIVIGSDMDAVSGKLGIKLGSLINQSVEIENRSVKVNFFFRRPTRIRAMRSTNWLRQREAVRDCSFEIMLLLKSLAIRMRQIQSSDASWLLRRRPSIPLIFL